MELLDFYFLFYFIFYTELRQGSCRGNFEPNEHFDTAGAARCFSSCCGADCPTCEESPGAEIQTVLLSDSQEQRFVENFILA